MSVIQEEDHRFYRLITLSYKYAPLVVVGIIDNYLSSQNLSFEQFLNNNKHEIYHKRHCYSACCSCRQSKSQKVFLEVQWTSLFQSGPTPQQHLGHDLSKCHGVFSARTGIDLGVCDVSLASALINNVSDLLQHYLNGLCQALHPSKGFEMFLEQNKHILFHFLDKRRCCQCNSDPDKKEIFKRKEWIKLYRVQTATAGQHTICSCKFNPILGLTLPAVDPDIVSKIGQAAGPVLLVRSIRNEVLAHSKSATLNDKYFESTWKQLTEALIESHSVFGMRSSIDLKKCILELKNCPIDGTMWKELHQLILRDADLRKLIEEIQIAQTAQSQTIDEVRLEQTAQSQNIAVQGQTIDDVRLEQTAQSQNIAVQGQHITKLLLEQTNQCQAATEILKEQAGQKHDISEVRTEQGQIRKEQIHIIKKQKEQTEETKKLQSDMYAPKKYIKAHATTEMMKHQKTIDALGLTYATRLSASVYKKLQEQKIVTLTGIPGTGKKHLALNVLKLFLDDHPEMEIIILHDFKDFKKTFDPSKTYLILINDIIGKFSVDTSLLHHWNSNTESFLSMVQSHSVFVVITIRKSVMRGCSRDIVEQMFGRPYIFDLDTNTLNNDEKKKIFMKYAKLHDVVYTDTDLNKIIALESPGRGFPSLCSSMKDKHVVNHFSRPVDLIKEDILLFEKYDVAGFVALLMTVLCDGNLNLSSLSTEQSHCLDILQSNYGVKHITKSLFTLENTYLIKKETKTLFLHHCIAEATFHAAMESVPTILIDCCPISLLVTFIEKYFKEKVYKLEFPFELIFHRFKEEMHAGNIRSIVGCKTLWENKTFVAITLRELDFYKEIGDGRKSLLCRFSCLGYDVLVQRILTRQGMQVTNETKRRAILKSVVNACIKNQPKCVQLLISEIGRVPDEVMFAAIQGRDTSVMEILLGRGGDISVKNEESGECLLHVACTRNNIDMLKIILDRCSLLQKKELVSHKSNLCHAIPLMYAAEKSDLCLFIQLLDSGSDVKSNDKYGFNCLHYALLGGKFETVQYICTHNEDMLTSKSYNGTTVAHAASRGGDITCLEFVLKRGFDYVTTADDGCTFLHTAALCGKVEVVKYICEKMEEIVSLVDRDQWNAAHFAAKGNHPKCLTYILEKGGKSMLQKTQEGYTLLHLATDVGVIMYLCENYDFMLAEIDSEGWNASHYAASRGDKQCLEYLLGKGVDATCSTTSKMTILHIAASRGKTDTIQFLFDSPFVPHKDMLSLESNNGFNAAFHAASNGHLECLIDLVKQGLSLEKQNIQGETILHICAREGRLNIVTYMCEKCSQSTVCKKDMFGSNAAFAATEGGNLNCITHLIKSGIDPLERGCDGQTLLHIAALHGHYGVLEYLCKSFEDLVRMTTDDHMNAAHSAVLGGHLRCLVFLLEHGVDPMSVTEHGQTLLHISAIHGRLEMTMYLCKEHANLIQTLDKRYQTALHAAASTGKLEVLRYLCNSHETLISKMNKKGQNAAHIALLGNHMDCMKYLLDQGISPSSETQLTLLHVASENGKLELVKYLIDRYDYLLHVTDENDRTAASYAILGGHLECLKYLIEQVKDQRSTCNDYVDLSSFLNLLHLAILRKSLDIVRFLCETFERLAFMTDNHGLNACHHAARVAALDCLKYLKEESKGILPTDKTNDGSTILHLTTDIDVLQYICLTYPRMINTQNNDGWTAAHYAAYRGNLNCLEYLVNNGLDPTIGTKEGKTILHLAAAGGKLNIIKFLTESPHLNFRTNVNGVCFQGWNAAFHAAVSGHLDCLKYLLQNVISPKLRTIEGKTLLHAAAHEGQLEIVKYICKVFKEMIHETDMYDSNAAFSASHGGHLDCLVYLITHGIDARGRDTSGKTILHTAVKCGHMEIVEHICTSYTDVLRMTSNDDFTAAHESVIGNQMHCMQYLLEHGLDPCRVNKLGQTLLHLAVSFDRFDMVMYLCERHRYLIEIQDSRKRNAAQTAIIEDKFTCLEYLIEQGTDLDCVTVSDASLLHVAAVYGRLEMMILLCSKHRFLVEMIDKNHCNAAHYSIIGNKLNCLMYLLNEQGIPPDCRLKTKETFIHFAASSGNIDLLKYLCASFPFLIDKSDARGHNAAHYAIAYDTFDCFKCLIENGLNPLLCSSSGVSLLHTACEKGLITFVDYLCTSPVVPHQDLLYFEDEKKQNAAHYAAASGSVQCLSALLRYGVKPESKNMKGRTILHVASLHNRFAVVKFISEHHSHVMEINDINGFNPLDYAYAHRNEECIQYLKSKNMKRTYGYGIVVNTLKKEFQESKLGINVSDKFQEVKNLFK